MSTVAVAAAPAAAVGFGPVLLALGVVGLAVAAGLRAEARRRELEAESAGAAEREDLRDRLTQAVHEQSASLRAEQRRRQEEADRAAEAERRALLEAALRRAATSLRAEIDQVADARERTRLSAELDGLRAPLKAELAQGRDTKATRLLNELRQRIAAVRAEEAILAEQGVALTRLLDQALDQAGPLAPAGFVAKVAALRREAERKDIPLHERPGHLAALKPQVGRLVHVGGTARAVLREDPVFAAPAENQETAALIAEIADYAERAAFFDEREAAALRPLVEEALSAARDDADPFRLGLIRAQVKTAYGRLKEEATLTALFRQDLREFLPLVRKAEGPEAEALRLRLEDLLAAPVLARADYERAYEAARTLFSEQMERIADAVLAEKIGAELAGLGYELLDEAGRPAPLVPGAVHTLNAPGPDGTGYRVRVKVDGGGLAVRLVRVAGSEAERERVSEYRRQRDVEAGRKWCADLDKLYRALEDAGIPLRDRLRREPGEEPLEVVVDAAAARPGSAARRETGPEARAARP